MSYLIDSNQLAYSVNRAAPQQAPVREAFRLLTVGQYASIVVPQTLTEFWAVATRPTAPDNGRPGLGMTPEQASAEIDVFRDTFTFLPDMPDIFDEWRRIALMHQVQGRQVHDARLVAVMWVHGIDRILTNNVRDFRRYPRIQAVTPEELPDLLRADRETPSP